MRGPPRDPCAEASAFDWAVPGELEAAVQERNHIGFDLLSGCRLHEQVREVAVVGWEEDVAVANDVPLFTCNPDDFAGIEGLTVVPIPHPDAI